jgi:hypothetical protein
MLPVTCCDLLTFKQAGRRQKIRLGSVQSLILYSLFITHRYPRDKAAEGKEENKPKD